MKNTAIAKNIGLLVITTALSGTGLAQTAYNISFDETVAGLDHGSLFAGDEYSGLGAGGVTFTVNSKGSHDQLIIFDTDNTSGTADPDLESTFIGGNLQNVRGLGNALIIAENVIDNDRNGIVDSPDDEAAGGTIGVIFANSNVSHVGFSLYDTPENIESDVSIVFRDANGNSVTWRAAELVSHGSGVEFGNHYANHFSGIEASNLGLSNIQSIDFNIESGAVDSLHYYVVPEPSSAALLGMGIASLVLRRKRAS